MCCIGNFGWDSFYTWLAKCTMLRLSGSLIPQAPLLFVRPADRTASRIGKSYIQEQPFINHSLQRMNFSFPISLWNSPSNLTLEMRQVVDFSLEKTLISVSRFQNSILSLLYSKIWKWEWPLFTCPLYNAGSGKRALTLACQVSTKNEVG